MREGGSEAIEYLSGGSADQAIELDCGVSSGTCRDCHCGALLFQDLVVQVAV